jgi:uncharacterized protein YciI
LNHYIIIYKPPRSTFVDDATDEESKHIENHFEYLKKLLAENVLILAGRTDDAHLGIAIFEAESIVKAKEIMANDPAIKSGVFTGELHQFRLALIQN